MSLLVAVAFSGAHAAANIPRGSLFRAGDDEAVGFDEVVPEEPKEEGKPVKTPEPEVVEPVRVLPAPPETREKPGPPSPGRRLNLAIEAGGFLPVKGAGTDYDPSFSVGARMWKKLNPRTGLALSFGYARLQSPRSTDHFFLVLAGVRLRLSGEDIATCPLYAGLGAGFAAEDPTDDYEGNLLGNLGPTVSVRLGLRLGSRLDLGLEYVAFPDGENAPGVGLALLGYSF